MKRAAKLKNIQQEKDINKMKRKEAMDKKLGLTRQNKAVKKDDSDWEDIDEHERDVFDKDGYYDVMNDQDDIAESDLQLLEKFQGQKKVGFSDKPDEKAAGGVNLADLIMQKMATGDYEDGNAEDQLDPNQIDTMDPKIVAAYQKIGVVMKTYRSGKLPKAFKVIPMVANWEDLLFLTKPETWSCNATFQATKIFASNMNGKMVQRFYSLILLPAVRENIATYKKLNCHLYMAIKKSMFKTGAFFKGFLLPLAEDASAREAVIVGSVLAKMSINTLDAAAAILKLSSSEYKIGSGFFLKTLLAKKYALPTVVVNTLVGFFCKFIDQGYVSEEGEEATEMPVMWHQTLLTYV